MKDNTQKKKGNSRLSKAQIILGLALLAAGLVVYGLDACQIASIPYSKAIFVCATCLGIFFAASGACDIFLKSTEAMDTEAGDEQNKALADAPWPLGQDHVRSCLSRHIHTCCIRPSGIPVMYHSHTGLCRRAGSVHFQAHSSSQIHISAASVPMNITDGKGRDRPFPHILCSTAAQEAENAPFRMLPPLG